MDKKAEASFLDYLAIRLYGMTKADAHKKSICISCKFYVKLEGINLDEYKITALCPLCFDRAIETEEVNAS